MTTREPDRFEAKARELAKSIFYEDPDEADIAERIAAALRAAESSALERAAQEADQYESRLIANSIRALIPPAAAPAADRLALPECPGPDCKACNGEACGLCGAGCWSHVSNCEHDVVDRHRDLAAPAAETGKAQGAEALPFLRSDAEMAVLGAQSLAARLTEWAAALRAALDRARAAPPEETTCKGLPHVKRHKCMRCGGEFECTSFGCTAGDDVLPRRLIGGVVVEHDCTPTRKGTEWRVPTEGPTT